MTIDVTDVNNKKWTYYDIYGGQITRDDITDGESFITKSLSQNIYGADKSPAQYWDSLSLAFADRDFQAIYGSFKEDDFKDNPRYKRDEKSGLVVSRGMEATEKAIRVRLADQVNKWYGLSSPFKADDFKEIPGLKDQKTDDLVFFTLNNRAWHMVGNTWIAAYGTVFYDFKYQYVEDGEVADSAVGSETDPDKVVGKRGYTQKDAAFALIPGSTFLVENNTASPITRSAAFSKTYSNTVENSTNVTESTTNQIMTGLSVEANAKIPFIGESKVTAKFEYTHQWLSSTENGHSESLKMEQTFSDSATVEVPAQSVQQVSWWQGDIGYGIQYDYPISLTYKTAHYCIRWKTIGTTKSSLIALFGNDPDGKIAFAAGNLFYRYRNRDAAGYEQTHCGGDGLEVDWSKYSASSKAVDMLGERVPMSVSGATINASGSQFKAVVDPPTPVHPAGEIKLGGSDTLLLKVGGALNLTGCVPATVLQDCEGEIPFYGFDARTQGRWAIVNELGAEAPSELAALEKTQDGFILTAGTTPGTVKLKFLLDEQAEYNIGKRVGDKLAIATDTFTNEGVDNRQLLTVKIAPVSVVNDELYNVRVLTDSITVPVNTYVDLLKDGPAVSVTDEGGHEVEPPMPIVWTCKDEPDELFSLIDNRMISRGETPRTIYAKMGENISGPVTVHTDVGEGVYRVTLDRAQADLFVGEQTTLKAAVQPQDASNPTIVWTSSQPKVASVNNLGEITALRPGKAVIRARVSGDREVSAQCDVHVEAAVKGKDLRQGKLALVKGKQFTLGNPGKAKGVWSVDDETIATVSGQGNVKAKALGTTVLRFAVSAADKNASYLGKSVESGDVIQIPLAVRGKGEVVTDVTVPKKIVLAVGERYPVKPGLKPQRAADRETYMITNHADVAVAGADGVIEGVGKGSATVFVTAASGKSAKIAVTVTDQIQKLIPSEKKKTLLAGQTFFLTVSAAPAGFENPQLTYASSNGKVATVDETGFVVACGKGKAKITVTAPGGAKAVCTVKVK